MIEYAARDRRERDPAEIFRPRIAAHAAVADTHAGPRIRGEIDPADVLAPGIRVWQDIAARRRTLGQPASDGRQHQCNEAESQVRGHAASLGVALDTSNTQISPESG